MPSQPLNPAQKADAERLRALFKAWQRVLKDEGKNSSQEALAPLFGFGQSALSQYLNGGIPLNVGVLAKFAEVLGCAPSDISPDLSAQMNRFASVLPGSSEGGQTSDARQAKRAGGSPRQSKADARWPFTRIREDDLRALSQDDRSVVEGALALAIAQVGLKMPVGDSPGLSRRDQAAAIIRDASTTAANNADYIAIRKVAVKIAAGIAGFDTEQQRDDGTGASLYLARQWVEKHRYRWQALYATTAKGLSMWPRVKEGDVIVFNTDDTTQHADGIFAVNHEGEFTLKRLKKRLGHWWLYSDNEDQKKYPPVMCSALTFIIGRVVLMQSEQI